MGPALPPSLLLVALAQVYCERILAIGAGGATEEDGETPDEPEEVREDLRLADGAHGSLMRVAWPSWI